MGRRERGLAVEAEGVFRRQWLRKRETERCPLDLAAGQTPWACRAVEMRMEAG